MTNPPKKPLANSTLHLSPISLGYMGMSEFYGGTQSEAGHIKTLHTAIDLGVNHSDTADMYGAGHNEALVSSAFSDRWDKVTAATKFGVRRGGNGEWPGISGIYQVSAKKCRGATTK